MPNTILVPLDGSPLAEQALLHACRLARQMRAALVLVHARPAAAGMGKASPESADDVEKYLESVQERLRGDGFTVRSHALPGAAAEVILRAAATEQADLIAMGTHGRSGDQRFVLGSVAREVLGQTPLPLLLVRTAEQRATQDTAPYRNILVPLDGMPAAEAALSYLAEWAPDRDTEVLLLRAVRPFAASSAMHPGGYAHDLVIEQGTQRVEEDQVESRRYLNALAPARLRGRAYHSLVLADYPAPAILHAASAHGVDLILMVTQARLGPNRLLHTSVTKHVLQHTPAPVLLLPTAGRPDQAPTVNALHALVEPAEGADVRDYAD